jgi:arylsulfatase A-like enzyme
MQFLLHLFQVSVLWAVLILTAFLGLSPNTATAQLSKPNIVFIVEDDLDKEWIASYGGENVTTPNIDRLAEGGMRFLNVYSMPKCTPTRATLLTGQYPFRHGWVNHWDVPRWGRGCHFDPKAGLRKDTIITAFRAEITR